ncbi:hypothetical protein CVO77_17890 [Sphingopyxis lindanitolerans]|uniref:Uncharacterized protein n=1 Tax=Sphingopyxis lindanitolerans TaxID=2054227 RepID=A0A2S8B3D2_9SPHN|nr:DUF5694 domain-containing protein [Sphingopyxis lindanitolerans]PQM26853.1 hypothetical protein CVO77_17890 [Sphingopyxis lindanitolerans]
MSLFAALLFVAGTNAPPPYAPSFDPAALKAGTAGELLVLGTPHLSGLPDGFSAVSLDPLLARLAAWKPRIITIEGVSGPDCDMLLSYKPLYPDVYDTYCWDPEPARKATGLDVPAATAEAGRLLAAWPANPAAAERRHLAAVFLAGGEQASALVQWLRLPTAERHAGDGLDAALTERLDTLTTRRNENFLIASTLAARLGLERVYSVDDHSADATTAWLNDDAGFNAALQRIWNNPVAKERAAADKALEAKLDGAGLLDLYRAYNSPATARVAYDSDFGAALADATPQNYGRRYVGWWETRNLRMAANIRAAMAAQPGARTLSIVGASHKGYFEAYLNRMHDVRLADAETILK